MRKLGIDRLARPTLDRELALWQSGVATVAGVDEVGRGPIAGPVVAAAVVLPFCIDTEWLCELRDSKVLSHKKRCELARLISGVADVGIGIVPSMLVDRMGIAPASRRAMVQAVSRLRQRPEHLLIDAFRIPELQIAQSPIIRGDSMVMSISAASIVAKVVRDQLMCDYDQIYPGYDLSRNKGYGTATHLSALRQLGPSPIHRRSFSPVSSTLISAETGQ